MEMCFRGCGREATHWDRKGHPTCAKSSNSCPAVKEKQAQACLAKYGSSKPLGNPQKMMDVKSKMMDEFGTLSSKQVGRIRRSIQEGSEDLTPQQKRKKTTFARYGVDHYSQTEDYKEKFQQTCLDRYGVDHPFKSKELQETRRQTLEKNLGVDHPFKSPQIREQIKATNTARYGCEVASCSDEIKQKTQTTVLARYGTLSVLQASEVKEKIRTSLRERYGVSSPFQKGIIRDAFRSKFQEDHGVQWPMQLQSCRDKNRQTCLIRYGTPSATQNPEVYAKIEKHAYRLKEVQLPSGRMVGLKGFEPKVLMELLTQHCLREEDFEFDRRLIPSISYFNPLLGREATYFPDFYIPRLNWILEVKSTFTLVGPSRKLWAVNQAKRKACLQAGFKFNFIVR